MCTCVLGGWERESWCDYALVHVHVYAYKERSKSKGVKVITPRACARGKIIGCVIVVVVSTKIAISRDVGI